MEWGQQFLNHEELINNATYQNVGYIDIRNKNKTLILDVVISNGTTFTKTLHEPFKIDKLSDIYLDSFTTFKTKNNETIFATPNPSIHVKQPNSLLYLLEIDQFNIMNKQLLARNNYKFCNKSSISCITFNCC